MTRSVLEAGKLFVDFANETGSPYHTVSACTKLLRANGFSELSDLKPWSIQNGGKYFVTKGGSDIMAFVVGKKFSATGGSGVSMVGAHTDSPCLRLRPNSKITSAGMLQVGIETYGGGLWHTWFDRPLGLAGRVVVRNSKNGHLAEKLVRITKPVMLLPNLAIHLQSAEERNAFNPNKESHLQPVLCSKLFNDKASEKAPEPADASAEPEPSPESRHHAALLEMVAKELDCHSSEILDADLCLMDANPAGLAGIFEEFISSPRIDNLLSTWAAVQGLCDFAGSGVAEDAQDISIAVSFDHEEVGSQSATGADGNTMLSWLEHIMGALDVPPLARTEVYAKSFLLSADCAHGVHPNYVGKHQSQHMPELHKGIVIKSNANQRYATTALTSALFREVCKRASVPVQDFVVRNDMPCGSTIGPIISSKTGIRTIDIGAPQWAMHSCRETCATSDASYLVTLCKAFFETFREIDNSTEKL